MMTLPSTECYKILVQGEYGIVPCYRTYWASSPTLGAAIDRVIDAAKSQNIIDPVPCLATLVGEIPDGALDLGGNILFCQREIHTWPSDSSYDSFQFPVGVIPCDNENDPDPDNIVEAYVVGTQEVPFDVEVVVDRRNLFDVFMSLVRWLPSASALEVRICGHWDTTNKTGIWLSPDWDSDEAIIRYITKRKRDLFLNGCVELGVYCRPEKATLRLTDHKTICFFAENKVCIEGCASELQRLGFKSVESALMIGRGFHHHHYRPWDSNDRVSLITELEADGLRCVDSIEDEEYDMSAE